MSEPRSKTATGPEGGGRHVTDVAVVGAGLAGLTAAATAARAGASVVLVEARDAIGGRARSEQVDGFVVNHGAHALYRAGAGTAVLRALGIRPTGGLPRQSGLAWWIDGERVPARHLSVAGGTDGVRAMTRLLLSRSRRRGAEGLTVAEWMDRHVPDRGRDLAEMLVRTSCYASDLTDLDATITLDQLARGARGVLYLDGGWQSLVSGLEAVARRAGVSFTTGRVESVSPGGRGGARGAGDSFTVEVRDGSPIEARSVVLAAGGASHAHELLGGSSALVAGWAAAADPISAACLDVAVTRPDGRRPSSTYGLGSPVYAVDHARSARLAPDGGAVHHALFYEPDRFPHVDHRGVLESMLDAQDPGWRERAVSVTFRKRSVVAHDRVRPAAAGSRPTVAVQDVDGVFVAGDWLTGHGMLADAPVTSGAEAGSAAAARSTGRVDHRRESPVPA